MIVIGTRKAIHDATYIAIRGKTQSIGYADPGIGRDNRMVSALEAGHIISAMERQPKDVCSWLWFCYAAYYQNLQREYLTNQTFQYVLSIRGKIKGNIKKIPQTYRICRLSLEDYRLRKNSNGAHTLSPGNMAICIDADPDNFHRDWDPIRQLVFDLAEIWDYKGIVEVSKDINHLR